MKNRKILTIFTMMSIGIAAVVFIFRNKSYHMNECLLSFENYAGKNVPFPNSLAVMNVDYTYQDSISVYKDSFWEDTELVLLEGEIYDVLIHQEYINGWIKNKNMQGYYDQYKDNYERYIEYEMKDMSLHYMGKLDVSEHFKSHLVLKIRETNGLEIQPMGEHDVRCLYLINVGSLDNMIKSIVLLAKYINGHQTIRMSTEILNNKSFLLKEVYMGAVDIIGSKGTTSYCKFHFDVEGYVWPDKF